MRDEKAAEELRGARVQGARRAADLRDAMGKVLTPKRIQAVVATLVKAAVQKEDVGAARLLLERTFGRPRPEPMSGVALDLPDGLQTPSDVRKATAALLRAVAEGSVTPEDAQKAASVVEAARKSIETEELEKRIAELEGRLNKNGRRR